MTTYTDRDRVLAGARLFGWKTDASEPMAVAFGRPVPMIDRRDEHMLVVTFDRRGALKAAFTGPTYRLQALTTDLETTLRHLKEYGS